MKAPSALTGHQQNVRIWRETFFKLFSRTIVGPWTSLVDASAQTWKDSLSIGSEQEFLFSQREIIGDGSPAAIWIGQTTLELRINELRSTIRDHNFIIFGSNYCQLPFDKWSWVTDVTLVLNWVKKSTIWAGKDFQAKVNEKGRYQWKFWHVFDLHQQCFRRLEWVSGRTRG